MLSLLLVLIAAGGTPSPSEVAESAAELLAKRARQAEGAAKPIAIERALHAYAALVRESRKDRKRHPRLRRRRASLLRHAERLPEALAEHDAILAGRARRADKARALYDGAQLLRRLGRHEEAIKRLSRAIERYSDATRTRARASRLRGSIQEQLGRLRDAERSYRFVAEKCRFEEKEAIAAHDALALLALRNGDRRRANRWLNACLRTYGRRAAKKDKKGAFLSRQLAAMKAPSAIAAADP